MTKDKGPATGDHAVATESTGQDGFRSFPDLLGREWGGLAPPFYRMRRQP